MKSRSEKQGGTKKDFQFPGLSDWERERREQQDIQALVGSQVLTGNGREERFVSGVKLGFGLQRDKVTIVPQLF